VTGFAQPDPLEPKADVAIVGSSAVARDKAPASAWYALAVLIATTLFAFVDRQIINLVAPSLQRDLGLSDMQLGIMQGLGLTLFASAAAYPIGWLSDRYGRRLILGCCIMLWSISTAACAFQSSFAGVFVATGGIAIGEAALSPVIFSMMPDLFPERQRNTANFIFFAVALLGIAIGLGLGGVTLSLLEKNHQQLPALFASMESWRVALILVAAPGPLFVLLLATIRMRSNSGRVALFGSDGRSINFDGIRPFVHQHWRPFACIYGAIFAYTMPLSAAFAWLPVAMPRIFPGVQASSVGLPLGIAVAAGSVVGLILPPVGMRLLRGDVTIRPLRLARIFLAAASAPTLFMLFAWEPWQFYAMVGAQLMVLLATGALMPGVLQQLSPPNLRSRLISVLGISSAVASGLSPMIVGAMSGLLDGHRGIIIAIVGVSLPAWLGAAALMSASRKPAAATIATIKLTQESS
jgi:predicted MFS family arabinose efflux permease